MNILIVLLFVMESLFQAIIAQTSTDSCVHRYTIVVDGGSTGTRLNIFKFNKETPVPQLLDIFVDKSKIVLSEVSALREDWSDLDQLIYSFINKSRLYVLPINCAIKTPFYLKTTSGMREIPNCLSSRIKNHINELLSKTEFLYENTFNRILSAEIEGALAWLSVNFLFKNFEMNESTKKETYGVLELGSGSTKITFATVDPELKRKSILLQILGKKYFIYSHGVDYLGIDVLRAKMFNAEECIKTKCENKTYRSTCVHHNLTSTLKITGRKIKIKGESTLDSVRMLDCYAKSVTFLKNLEYVEPYIDNITFVMISVYYSVLNNAPGIISESKTTSVPTIVGAARERCNNPEQYYDKDKYYLNFLCMDLTYLVALLIDGYGIGITNKLKCHKEIDNKPVSYSMGFALSNILL